jgi:hypothetical protein
MKKKSVSIAHSRRLRTFGEVAVIAAMAATAQAATITWANQWVTHSATETVLFGPLSTAGVLAQAENLGSTNSATVDTGHGSITFGPDTSAPGFRRLGDSAESFGGPYFNYATQPLLNAADWGPAAGGTLVLSGLTINQEYLIELLSVDNRGGMSTAVLLSVDNGPFVSYRTGNGSGGYRLFTGSFTADATSQSIAISIAGGSGNPQLNAFQLRAIPEPSALLLLGLGSLGLALRRRR